MSYPGTGVKEIGVFAATRWEVRPVRRALDEAHPQTVAGVRCLVGRRADCRVWVFRTGVGHVHAAALCRDVFAAQSFHVALSTGFACALIPAHVADLLVGTRVRTCSPEEAWSRQGDELGCAEPWTQAALQTGRCEGLPMHAGLFVTLPSIVCRAREKHEIAKATGAVGLDMESAAVAAAANERGVPFAIVRAASDLVDEDLPLDFNRFRRRGGWLNAAGHCLVHPSSLARLRRLGRQSARAADRLTTFFREFFDHLEERLPSG